MQLIDRYVQAVKSYLPIKIRDDIGEELQLLLNEKLDDMRESNDGELNEEAIIEFLKRQGHPMKVAAGYREVSALVSETLFPIYRQALIWVLGIIVAIQIFSWALGIISGWEVRSLMDLVFNTLNALMLGFAYATIAFHLGGKILEKQGLLKNWDPRKLPAIHTDWQNMPRGESIPSLIGNLLLLAMFNGLSPLHYDYVSLQASAEFAALLPWANGILLFSLAYDVEKIFRPLHTRFTTISALVLTTATLILLGYIFFLDSRVVLQLGEHVFEPIKPYTVAIAMCIIFFVEGLPNGQRLLRMI